MCLKDIQGKSQIESKVSLAVKADHYVHLGLLALEM
jgi:hypothetical protein